MATIRNNDYDSDSNNNDHDNDSNNNDNNNKMTLTVTTMTMTMTVTNHDWSCMASDTSWNVFVLCLCMQLQFLRFCLNLQRLQNVSGMSSRFCMFSNLVSQAVLCPCLSSFYTKQTKTKLSIVCSIVDCLMMALWFVCNHRSSC